MSKLQGWKILVVDDDPKGLHIIKSLLRYYGAEVSTGVNGEDGLEILKTLSPDLIISDMSMPKMDGWTMISHVKKDRRTAEIPIIALTAHAMSGDRERAIALGCHNYLTKPITPQTFLNELLTILEEIPELVGRL